MIVFNDNLRIRMMDKYNLIIEISHKQKKDNKLRWDIVGYFPSLESALEYLITRDLFSLIGSIDTKIEIIKLVEEVAKLKTYIHETLKRDLKT